MAATAHKLRVRLSTVSTSLEGVGLTRVFARLRASSSWRENWIQMKGASLADAEFEEIVQIVLQKSLQECLGPYVVWVQCSSPNCEKWRRLHENIDPSVLPENWSCDQNTDMEYNRCDIPEETWIGHESDVAYASYIPGSIIWAKQYGYPWWPGMIESDPDLGEYFLFASHLDSLPAKYHVTFFGETVYRAWISANMLKNFQEMSLELAGVTKYKNKDYSQELRAALVMAQEAQRISIQDRVNSFGFHSRHNGFDSPDGGKGPKKKFQAPQSKCPVTSLSEERAVRRVSKDLAPPTEIGACPTAEEEVPQPQESRHQEAAGIPPEDEASSDLNLEQLLEDVGREPELVEEPQFRDEEGFAVALFEE
ncbi:zinc finger CW-type PWWP domain protein 1 [Rhynchocyon petersi]